MEFILVFFLSIFVTLSSDSENPGSHVPSGRLLMGPVPQEVATLTLLSLLCSKTPGSAAQMPSHPTGPLMYHDFGPQRGKSHLA